MATLKDKLNKKKFGPGMGILGQTSESLRAEIPKAQPSPAQDKKSMSELMAEEEQDEQVQQEQPAVPSQLIIPEPPEKEKPPVDYLKSWYDKFNQENQRAFERLEKSQQELLTEKRNALKERLDKLEEKREQALTRQQYLELANTLGQAFAQIGAAYSGLRSGTDGRIQTEFNPQLWARNYDRILERFDRAEAQERRDIEETFQPTEQKTKEQFEQELRARWALMQDRIQDARRTAAQAQAGDNTEEQLAKARAKVKSKYADIRSEMFKMDEGDQDKSKTIANINKKLEGLVTPEQLKELSEERGGRSIWDLWLVDRPDQFKSFIDKLEAKELEMLGGEPQGLQPGTIQDGYRFKGGDPANPASWEKVQ